MRVRGTGRAKHLVATLRALGSAALEARRKSGKPVAAQLAEIVALRRGGLAAGEYYVYSLFDDSRFGPAEKREYVGRRFQWSVFRQVNDPGLVAPSGIAGSWNGMVDKGLFGLLMQAADLATPRTLAVFDPAGAELPGTETLRVHADLDAFLRAIGDEGAFTKPARAASGDDAFAIRSVRGDDAVLGNGDVVPLRTLLPAVTARGRTLVQELLRPHPVLEQVVGSTVATVRLLVLRSPRASIVHRAVLRIPAGRAMVDNFHNGTTGNALAVVVPDTGRVAAAWHGVGPTQRRLERHPDTGRPLPGLRLPDWQRARELVERASRLLAGMALQSWDLALTERGPVLIEVNDVSSVDVLQLCGPPGLLDGQLEAFLRERGVRRLRP